MTHAGPSLAESFWDHVLDVDGCLEWQAARIRSGYGVVWADKRLTYAHRFAWQQTFGAIPDGLRVLHHCDNPPCVRPDHLFLGTAADNSRDMVRKGRMIQQRDPSKQRRGPRGRTT